MDQQPQPESKSAESLLKEINREVSNLHTSLHINKVSYYGAKTIYVSLEILLYMCALGCVIFAVWIPLDPISYAQKIDAQSFVAVKYHHETITALMWLIRGSILGMSFMLFMSGFVIRRLRKKNDRLMTAFKRIDQLKKLLNPA